MIASRLALYIKYSQPLVESTVKQLNSEPKQQEHMLWHAYQTNICNLEAYKCHKQIWWMYRHKSGFY